MWHENGYFTCSHNLENYCIILLSLESVVYFHANFNLNTRNCNENDEINEIFDVITSVKDRFVNV